MTSTERLVRAAVVGMSSGKTSLINAFLTGAADGTPDHDPPETVVEVEGQSFRAVFHEASHTDPKLLDVMTSADLYVLVYAIDSLESFELVPGIADLLKKVLPRHKNVEARTRAPAMVLIGTRCDSPSRSREVTYKNGEELAYLFGSPFFEVSAVTGEGVQDAMMAGLAEIAKKEATSLARDSIGRERMQRLQEKRNTRMSIAMMVGNIPGVDDDQPPPAAAAASGSGVPDGPPPAYTPPSGGSGGSSPKPTARPSLPPGREVAVAGGSGNGGAKTNGTGGRGPQPPTPNAKPKERTRRPKVTPKPKRGRNATMRGGRGRGRGAAARGRGGRGGSATLRPGTRPSPPTKPAPPGGRGGGAAGRGQPLGAVIQKGPVAKARATGRRQMRLSLSGNMIPEELLPPPEFRDGGGGGGEPSGSGANGPRPKTKPRPRPRPGNRVRAQTGQTPGSGPAVTDAQLRRGTTDDAAVTPDGSAESEGSEDLFEDDGDDDDDDDLIEESSDTAVSASTSNGGGAAGGGQQRVGAASARLTAADLSSLNALDIDPSLYPAAVAKYDYAATAETQLSIRAGQEIAVLLKANAWWYGLVDGRMGYFPASYVEPVTNTVAEVREESDITPLPDFPKLVKMNKAFAPVQHNLLEVSTIREGWLHIGVQGQKGVRKRWVVLTDASVSFFKKESHGRARKKCTTVLSLKDTRKVTLDGAHVKGKKHAFALPTVKGRVVSFAAASRRDLEAWIESVVQAQSRDRCFGVSMEGLVAKYRRKGAGIQLVPTIVSKCISHLETRGFIHMEGIYRISGITGEINALREEFDEDEAYVDASFEDYDDWNAITGCLKLWLRTLPEPLVPYSCFEALMDVSREFPRREEINHRIEPIAKIVATMPPANLATLMYICRHCANVARFADENKMTPSNLSIVFGPTLLWAEDRDEMSLASLTNTKFQSATVQDFIERWDEIFQRYW